MHIGIAGPVDLAPLRHRIPASDLPPTYSFPLVGRLAEELIVRGHAVSVFAESTDVAQTRMFQDGKLKVFVCPLRLRRAAYDFYAFERKHLADAMRESRCELIHAHWTYEFAAAAQDTGIPCLITAHDSPLAILRYFVLTRYFPFWTAKAVIGVMVMRRARRMTTVSPYCKEDIERLIKPSAPVTVVPNGVEQAILAMGSTRLSRGIPSKLLTLATVLEGFQERKNPKAAIRAFAQIRATFPDASLQMFGTGYEAEGPASAWSRTHGLANGIEFMGRVPHADLMSHMAQNVHLLVHPAKEESFGMAPLEAMALGIPVIGGRNSGGVPYVLDGGGAGCLVDVRSPADIAQAALELLGSPSKMLQLAQKGWQRANSFTVDKMVDAYLQEYGILGN